MNFATLPNLIALAVLVAVFWAIAGRTPSQRLHFWLAGWVLVLLHFTAEFLCPHHGLLGTACAIAAVDCLVLAAVAFLTSFWGERDHDQRLQLAACIAAPCLIYATTAAYGVLSKGAYFLIIVGGASFALVSCWRVLAPGKARIVSLVMVAASIAFVAEWTVARGLPNLGVAAVLAALNFGAALLFATSYRRFSAGVVTTVVGFALWGAVFPLTFLLKKFTTVISVRTEAWNIPEYLVAVGMILTLFEDQIETSKYHAHHDELTGLPNRRLLDDRLGLALAYARRAKSKIAILQLDLNRFKEVNDTYGHRAGDVALREIAARLTTCIHHDDTLARSGGDEFTVISYLEDRATVKALVTALETALSAPILVDGNEIHTGLSIGMAIYPDDGGDPDQLHASADRAMYAVKRAGRATGANEGDHDGASVSGEEPVTMMPGSR